MSQSSIVYQGQVIVREINTNVVTEEVYYVKPQAQTVVVAYHPKSKKINYLDYLLALFLPSGYPDSVSKDYLAYQIWDSAQAFCSTITGTLATHEVLKGVGVGNTDASPLAATVTWVIRDGSGHIGRIMFAASHGPLLDAYSKKWRLYADTLNDAAMCIEMALPLFKNYTLFALCFSSCMKAIVGVAGGATRAALTQHHAIKGNMADVSAKDSAQETAVNLVASFAAIFIISVFGNSLFIFFVMMILHIVCNYLAVRAICLRTLNEPRFLKVIEKYLQREVLETPCKINSEEPLFSYHLGPNKLDLQLTGFRIRLGWSLKQILTANKEATHISSIMDVYEKRKYFLYPNVATREMFVFLDINADTNDVMCAYFHGVLLSVITSAINNKDVPIIEVFDYRRPFSAICEVLKNEDWSRIHVEDSVNTPSQLEHEPSLSAMVYLDKIAQQEWPRIWKGMSCTGWDMTKHLLVTNGWHYSRKDISVTEITPSVTLEDEVDYEEVTRSEVAKKNSNMHIDTNVNQYIDNLDGIASIKDPLEVKEILAAPSATTVNLKNTEEQIKLI